MIAPNRSAVPWVGPTAAITPSLSADPVIRFILLCLRARFDQAASVEARALLPAVDWPTLREIVWAENLAPLIYHVVRDQALVPADLEAELRRSYDANVLRNTFLFHRLEELLAALGDAGIETILLKGAALSHAIYGRSAVRPMGDLDVLVRPGDAPAALRALEAIGYRCKTLEATPGATLAYENEVLLEKAGPLPALVEVHWGLLDSPYYQRALDMTWFWRTALPVRVGSADALILGPEAQLLHLCAHLALHHRGQGFLWRHDIAEVTQAYRGRLDWDLLLAQTQAFDLVLPVQQLLMEVVTQWQAPIPPAIRERLGDLRPSSTEMRVYRWLTAGQRPVALRFWADLASMSSGRARLRYMLSNLFPSVTYMRQRYGVRRLALLPFYYLYRYGLGLRGLLRSLADPR